MTQRKQKDYAIKAINHYNSTKKFFITTAETLNGFYDAKDKDHLRQTF